MFDSISLGTSGLQTFSSGLKVISNNVANLNTPGFKGSHASFSNLYYAQGGSGNDLAARDAEQSGGGVTLGQTFLDMRAGETRQTGNPLDLSLDGEGFFIVKSATGEGTWYTRAGQFEFDSKGILVLRGTEQQVVGLDEAGTHMPITLDGLRISPPTPTTTVTMTGNLSAGATSADVSDVKVIDTSGGEHSLSLNFAPKTGESGTWSVTVTEAGLTVGSGEITFIGGSPSVGSDSMSFSFAPTGAQAGTIKLDFSKNVTSFNTGTTSSLAVSESDGHAVGSLTKASFDTDGVLNLEYSNGEKAKGGRVALAIFDSTRELVAQDNSLFKYASSQGIHIGRANGGGFGSVTSEKVEGSNVDLSAEFSDLIVTQRGYQASSRIVSTASDMLQELFDMKGRS